MGLNLKQEREHYINIISSVLETNILVMTYYKHRTNDPKAKAICNNSIKSAKKGLEKLPTINHIEILRSLFNNIIVGKEQLFVVASSICSLKNIDKWDKTEKGFKEFLYKEELAKKELETKVAEEKRQQEIIAKAKEQGKKVEMVYDNETKRLKPVIVEEKQ